MWKQGCSSFPTIQCAVRWRSYFGFTLRCSYFFFRVYFFFFLVRQLAPSSFALMNDLLPKLLHFECVRPMSDESTTVDHASVRLPHFRFKWSFAFEFFWPNAANAIGRPLIVCNFSADKLFCTRIYVILGSTGLYYLFQLPYENRPSVLNQFFLMAEISRGDGSFARAFRVFLFVFLFVTRRWWTEEIWLEIMKLQSS